MQKIFMLSVCIDTAGTAGNATENNHSFVDLSCDQQVQVSYSLFWIFRELNIQDKLSVCGYALTPHWTRLWHIIFAI